MAATGNSLHLAVEIDGAGSHPAAWREWGHAPSEVLSPKILRNLVGVAERGGFALVTLADRIVPEDGGGPIGRLDAGTRAAYLAATTGSVGLAPTVQTLTTEPFHLATQLASLDHGSRGRAGWVVGGDNSLEANVAVGYNPRDVDSAPREVREVVEVARRLWDSWEDDAVVRDVATGRYLDPDKVRHVRFSGEFFSVVGPLITPRPPQGQVVVLGDTDLGISDLLDVALVSGPDVAAIEAVARAQGTPLTFAEIDVVFDSDADTAQSRLARLDAHTEWVETGHLRFVGSPALFVDVLRSLAGIVDGVRLHPAVATTDLTVFVDKVLPVLADSGVHHAPRPGSTLRETLGLARPVNRYATATNN